MFKNTRQSIGHCKNQEFGYCYKLISFYFFLVKISENLKNSIKKDQAAINLQNMLPKQKYDKKITLLVFYHIGGL